jgi:hypothetical protein
VTAVFPLAHVTVPTPWSIAQLAALVIPVHDNVVECPACTVVGVAVNVPIAGRDDCTVTLHVAVVPRVTVTV